MDTSLRRSASPATPHSLRIKLLCKCETSDGLISTGLCLWLTGGTYVFVWQWCPGVRSWEPVSAASLDAAYPRAPIPLKTKAIKAAVLEWLL